MSESVMSTGEAFVLGLVEGVTEFLPISSTGHLVITSELMGLHESSKLTTSQLEAIQSFEIVIQGGAILAVAVLYRLQLVETIRGLFGRSEAGRKLLINMICATFPVLAVGFLLKDFISSHLQFTGPVLIALVAGGLAMLTFERFLASRRKVDEKLGSVQDLTWKQALAVGFIQCLALWPGTSRSMVTIIGGMLMGLARPAAAEFSFLAGLPVLLVASSYKAIKSGNELVLHIGPLPLLVGMATSAIAAILAMKWLISFLNRYGLAFFGWYRLGLALLVFLIVYI